MSDNSYLDIQAATRLPHAGFTLIELAVAIFIIALLLGSILVPLATQVEQRQINATQKTMDDVRDALLGFAAANGYLPCPDLRVGGVPNDGIEDVSTAGGTAGRCTSISGSAPDALSGGNVPWVTLGLAQQDAWGNRYTYLVLETYARRSPATSLANLATTGGLRVCTTATCTSALTTTAVAILISHGTNGLSAINAATNVANPIATTADELENADNDGNAVSRTKSTVSGSEFDDIVVWLPKYILNNRLVAAGKLP